MPTAVVDTNALIASLDPDELHHEAVVSAMSNRSLRFVIPALCIAEASYLIERDYGPRVEATFLESLRLFEVIAPEGDDWVRIAELVRQYADFPLGGTDASIVALAERLETDTVITLDRRHFSAVRPAHRERLRLLPEL